MLETWTVMWAHSQQLCQWHHSPACGLSLQADRRRSVSVISVFNEELYSFLRAPSYSLWMLQLLTCTSLFISSIFPFIFLQHCKELLLWRLSGRRLPVETKVFFERHLVPRNGSLSESGGWFQLSVVRWGSAITKLLPKMMIIVLLLLGKKAALNTHARRGGCGFVRSV